MLFVKAETKVLFSNDLKPLSRLILVGLKYFDRGNGRGCFASKEVISNMLGVSLWQLRTGLKELQEKNYIHIDKRGQGNTDVIFVIDADEEEKELQSKPENTADVDIKKPKSSPHHYYISKQNRNRGANISKGYEKRTGTDVTDRLTTSASLDLSIDQPATEECHRRLQECLGYNKWETYFKDAFVSEETDMEVTLVIPSPVIYDFVVKHLSVKINQALGKNVVCTFGVGLNKSLGEKANMV